MDIKYFFERMFFSPTWYHHVVMVLLFPLSLIYGSLMFIRRVLTKKVSFDIPIISVGNLVVGGSGKTPFVISLALHIGDVVIISRGYGRQSSGLVEVSRKGEILCSAEQSGDEPMLMARSLPLASVIVSEDRVKAITLAKEQGAKCIILDDGFNRVQIDKFEILLEPECIANTLPFPAGALREFYFTKRYADIVAKENRDFKRIVKIANQTKRMLLVTAISNPKRLESYLPKGVVGKVYYSDHAYFEEDKLKELLKKYEADSLLCTSKDRVKMDNFDIAISEMLLDLEINAGIFKKIQRYLDIY